MAQLQTWDNFELKMCELLLEQRPVMVGYYHKSHVQWLVLQKKLHPKVRNHGEGPY